MNAKFYPGSYFGKQCKAALDCMTTAASTKKSAERDSKVKGYLAGVIRTALNESNLNQHTTGLTTKNLKPGIICLKR